MSASSTPEALALVNIVNQSPRAVKSRVCEEWLNAFDDNATVEDPNGSPTQCGRSALKIFHATLVAPHNITFDIKRDFVDVVNKRVIRLTDIHVEYFHNGLGVGQIQPTHLVYDVDKRITALRANWELAQTRLLGGNNLVIKFLSMLALGLGGPFYPLIYNFGLRFAVVYTLSLFIGMTYSGGKAVNAKLLEAVERRSRADFVKLFTNSEARIVTFGAERLTPGEWFDHLANGGSGTNDMRLMDEPITSAYRTACWFERKHGNGKHYQGVYHFESQKPSLFASSSEEARITQVYFYEELDE